MQEDSPDLVTPLQVLPADEIGAEVEKYLRAASDDDER